jgi:hypothetical protein
MSSYDEAIRKANEVIGVKDEGPKVRNWLLDWVMDDCRNKNCIDGNVSYDNGKNCRLYRCPLCDRSKIPSASVDKGPVEEWTPEEMAMRLKDRKDVYFDGDFRYRRGKEIMALLAEISGAGRVKEPDVVGDGPF